MKCDELKTWLPDHWSGELDDELESRIGAHLDQCPGCRSEHDTLGAVWRKLELLPADAPSISLRARFYAMLEAYLQGREEAQPASGDLQRLPITGWRLRPAFQLGLAAALLLAGAAAGHLFTLSRTTNGEIVRLREEIRDMQQLVTLSLLQQQSASERLRGLSWSHRVPRPDQQILTALLRVLDEDPNVNVRLAAVDALYPFADQPVVRRGLVQALAHQGSPLVQISLIDLLVDIRERSSVEAFQKILETENLSEPVRQKAAWALRQVG